SLALLVPFFGCIGSHLLFCFFFFQAEDGIRDGHVTGVQTCALPILEPASPNDAKILLGGPSLWPIMATGATIRARKHMLTTSKRSEERRVGKECRSRWSP